MPKVKKVKAVKAWGIFTNFSNGLLGAYPTRKFAEEVLEGTLAENGSKIIPVLITPLK